MQKIALSCNRDKSNFVPYTFLQKITFVFRLFCAPPDNMVSQSSNGTSCLNYNALVQWTNKFFGPVRFFRRSNTIWRMFTDLGKSPTSLFSIIHEADSKHGAAHAASPALLLEASSTKFKAGKLAVDLNLRLDFLRFLLVDLVYASTEWNPKADPIGKMAKSKLSSFL